ncbi:DNA-3-methyladenine glycosylase II [Burkholderiales bacterium]|nr:DNA-3-methyladenine glycosylase II [Burkholderiales bacterium]
MKGATAVSPGRAPAVAAPAFWAPAKRRLRAADPTLASIIARHPRVRLVSRGDGFSTLARSIVGQQISVKAADSVWARLVERCPQMTPAALLRRRIATLRACGLSGRKAEYLRDLACHFADGRLDLQQLAGQPDDAVIDCLTDIRGIGRWTAEMFLIFNLQRPDVFPLDDLGLLKAISRHYFGGESTAGLLRGAGRERVAQLGARWTPYRSVATWYLWRSLDPVPVEY